ncbi:HlyD family secretion protein [Methylibium rhizosphaerae]|uniref:HlyD family secretion protein n=1 Tax=Methylibium rhizosphaerae TaxID=2570323 RepID=UPI00112C8BE9|nr:HlyD family efflux transporter periplasmic adaptor subunit [Methylibium rhizosphaerae]
MSSALFRTEALQQASHRQYGEILLARPMSHTVLVWLFAALVSAVVVFFFTFSVTRKVHVSGVLIPADGVLRVIAPQGGVVHERRASEGQKVKAGDVLFVLSSERASPGAAHTGLAVSELMRRRLASLQVDLNQQRLQASQRVEAARTRVQDLRAEGQRVIEQIALQRRRVALAEQALQRYQDLEREQFVSAATVQDRQSEVLDQQQRLADLERSHGSIVREQAALRSESELHDLQHRRDREAGMRAIATVEQEFAENEARRAVVVRATREGVVSALAVEAGQAVAIGQLLAVVLPVGSALEAELYAPSRAVGFIQPGAPVLVRYQAFPYQKFGQHQGVVREVAGVALRDGTDAGNEPVYRVRVRLPLQEVLAYDRPQPLRPGMTLDASLLLERRKLYEWVLEPLYSLGGRVSAR